eukprot:550358-Prymnesium_polylepis.2
MAPKVRCVARVRGSTKSAAEQGVVLLAYGHTYARLVDPRARRRRRKKSQLFYLKKDGCIPKKEGFDHLDRVSMG